MIHIHDYEKIEDTRYTHGKMITLYQCKKCRKIKLVNGLVKAKEFDEAISNPKLKMKCQNCGFDMSDMEPTNLRIAHGDDDNKIISITCPKCGMRVELVKSEIKQSVVSSIFKNLL